VKRTLARRLRCLAPACALGAAWFLLGALCAQADEATLLHVRAFTMSADHRTLRVGDKLHIVVDLQVDETVAQCTNVLLPDFYGFDSLGDERRTYTRPAGSDCSEIVTLSPTVAGWRTIAPATLDAVDANTSQPSHFSTNTVTVDVLDAPLQTGTILRNTLVQMLKAVIILLLMTIVGVGVYWGFRRTLPGFGAVRRIARQPMQPAEEEAAEASAPPAPPLDESARWAAVAAALSAQPTRQSVLAVRTILRDRVRAREDEVFGELLARVASTTDPALLDVMRTIERAAFIDDANLPATVRDAVRALERLADKPQMLSS
jgi:hypothetical protein